MRLWLARFLIGLVFLFNVQCAVFFLWKPESYAAAFELAHAPGAAMVRGLGVLFLMWNVPYAVALFNPQKYRLSLCEAIAMQAIGLAGETLILWNLPIAMEAARQTLLRFILFDGSGLVSLLLAGWISRK